MRPVATILIGFVASTVCLSICPMNAYGGMEMQNDMHGMHRQDGAGDEHQAPCEHCEDRADESYETLTTLPVEPATQPANAVTIFLLPTVPDLMAGNGENYSIETRGRSAVLRAIRTVVLRA